MKNPKIVDVALYVCHTFMKFYQGNLVNVFQEHWPYIITIYIIARIHVFIIRFEKINNYHCMRDRKRERGGNRTFNYKGLLTQYQNLRYLVEGIQSTAGEKRSQ